MYEVMNTTNTTVTTVNHTTAMSSFIDYVDRCDKTVNTYKCNLKQYVAYLRYKEIVRPIRKDVEAFRNYLMTEHNCIQLDNAAVKGWSFQVDHAGNVLRTTCKATTVANYLGTVKMFYKWASCNGLYENIAENIHAPKTNRELHKKDAFTTEELLQIENVMQATAQARQAKAQAAVKDNKGRIERSTIQGKRIYAMYLLTTNAGLRTIELERANVKDLEYKNGKAVIYIYGKGRNEADQKKYIASEVYNAIQDYLKSRTDKYTSASPLFVSTGNRSNGKRIAARTISTMLKQVEVQAGFNSERLTAHSLRHSVGTAVMEMTGNLYATQHYMRHANPGTTEIYIHEKNTDKEAGTATQLFNMIHNKDCNNSRQQLDATINNMSAEQIESLLQIAKAMNH